MPGPAPSPNARRRNARPEWRVLPAEGREGDPPDWPIGKGTTAERALWAELWSSPQAIAWADLGWVRVVARYCRLLVKAERGGAAASLLSEVRQLEDRLGLTPMAMKRLQWEVKLTAPVEPVEASEVTKLDDYRDLYG